MNMLKNLWFISVIQKCGSFALLTTVVIFVGFGGLTTISGGAKADDNLPPIDLAKVDNKETVDRRTDLSPEAWRMAVFFARDTSIFDMSIGHAYIALLTYRDDIKSFVTDRVFGLYPDKDQKFHLGQLPGGLDIRPLDSKPDSALLVWINPEQHSALGEIADQFDKTGEYQLLLNDCVSLMSDAATAAGLTKSLITLHPWAYVNDLMFLND